MTERTRSILRNLEAVREDLLGLSDELWKQVDHNDQDTLEEFLTAFKTPFNDSLRQFDQLTERLSGLVQAYTQVPISDSQPAKEEGESEQSQRERSDRLIAELNREQPHHITEDFTWKRPHGFILGNEAVSDVVTWKRLYERLCMLLARRNPELFNQLPDHPDHVTSRGNHWFARDAESLSVGSRITDTVFAETHASATGLARQIVRLLETFAIDPDELKIFLRQDRDAGDREVD